MPLTEAQRLALFLELHRSMEEAATEAAGSLVGLELPELHYPPNHGFTPAEAAALERIGSGGDLESALRKVIASAAYRPLIDLFRLIDGVMDPHDYAGAWPCFRLEPGAEDEQEEPPFFYYELPETYWAWRERRPDPGWRLDTWGDPPDAPRVSPEEMQRITLLETCTYDAQNRTLRESLENPTWEQVRDAIHNLDGAARSSLLLVASDGASITVGGGQGRFHVSTQSEPGSVTASASLIDSSRGEVEEDIVLGGSLTTLPACYIVDEERVLRSVHRFCHDGVLDPALEWEPY
jgi:hypothetical protein